MVDQSHDLSDERRLTRLEDIQEIRDLVIRYDFAADNFGDFPDNFESDTRAGLFAADGCLRHADGAVNVTGRDNLRKWFPMRGAEFGYKPLQPAIHAHVGHLVEFQDADSATGVVSAQSIRGTPDGTVAAANRDYDTYAREQGAWRFKERVLRYWYRMKLSELAAEFPGADRKRVPGPPAKADLPAPR